MKTVYPVVFTQLPDGYMAYVPDFQINTQGNDMAEAIAAARDAIGLVGIDREDDQKAIPAPSPLGAVAYAPDAILSLVDIDFSEYRRANEQRSVRRKVTLPAWLDSAAEKAGLNVSAVLQAALKKELGCNTTDA